MDAEDIIEMAYLLDPEDRLHVAESILKSLGPPDPEVEAAWMAEVERRIEQVRNGTAELIPGEEVFARIRERYGIATPNEEA